MSKLAVVCVNGPADQDVLSQVAGDHDSLLIAVDGGLETALALQDTHGLPDYLIGDLDSVSKTRLSEVQNNGHTRIECHPAEKNETDLELALIKAEQLGVDRVVLVGIAGGRLDQVMANVLLLVSREWQFDVEFLSVEGHGALITARYPWYGSLNPDTVVSLLPLSTVVEGVTTRGFYYPLESATLKFGTPRGISNVVSAAQASVSVQHGKLLLVVPPAESLNIQAAL